MYMTLCVCVVYYVDFVFNQDYFDVNLMIDYISGLTIYMFIIHYKLPTVLSPYHNVYRLIVYYNIYDIYIYIGTHTCVDTSLPPYINQRAISTTGARGREIKTRSSTPPTATVAIFT